MCYESLVVKHLKFSEHSNLSSEPEDLLISHNIMFT